MPEAFNPAVLPGDNMSPDTIDAAAAGMGTVGTKVSAQGGTVLTAWQKISASYHAPEEDSLFHAMNPVKTEAEKFGTDVATVSAALTTFAEEVRTIKAAVATLRADAATFRADIADGVAKTHVGAQGATSTTKIDWHEDPASVAANDALRNRAATQQEALWAAERKCANAIYDVIGHAHVQAASEANGNRGYGVDEIPDGAEMPWGAKVERTENCGEKIVYGVGDGASTMVGGIAGFFGAGYEPGTDLWDWKWDASWSTMGNTWKGLGMFAVGVGSMAVPFGREQAALTPGPLGQFVRDSQKSVDAMVAGLVAIDLYADDPLHKWKEDGFRAFGESVFNIATLVVAPTKIGNLGRAGRVGAATTRVSEALARAAQASAQAAKALAGPTVAALARLTRAADLDSTVKIEQVDIPSVGRDHVSTDVPNTGHRDGADAPPPRDHADDRAPADPRQESAPRPGQEVTVPDRGASTDGPDPRSSTDARSDGSGADRREGAGVDRGDGSPADRTDVTDAGRSDSSPVDRADSPADRGDGSPDAADPKPADTTPQNDPALAKTDPAVLSQVDQIRRDVGPELQKQADEAWQRAVTRADAEGVAKTPQRLGSYAHKELADWLQDNRGTLVAPGSGYRIRPEASFDLLGPTNPGARGSIRPDIVIERSTSAGGYQVVHVIDLKTGKAGIGKGWETHVQDWLKPLYPSETLRPTVPSTPPVPVPVR